MTLFSNIVVMQGLGIAEGLAYLHEKGIVHSDLKSVRYIFYIYCRFLPILQSNILMSSSGVPMLADFGQSRALYYTQEMLKTSAHESLKGSAHWMAYELVAFIDTADVQIICTKESDMWAFGMVIYVGSSLYFFFCYISHAHILQEIISGRLPYEHIKGPFPEFMIMHAIRGKELPVKPQVMNEEKEHLWNICIGCWKFDPKDRLTVEEAICHITLQGIEEVKSRVCCDWIADKRKAVIDMLAFLFGSPK